jgi:hypothetical protein
LLAAGGGRWTPRSWPMRSLPGTPSPSWSRRSVGWPVRCPTGPPRPPRCAAGMTTPRRASRRLTGMTGRQGRAGVGPGQRCQRVRVDVGDTRVSLGRAMVMTQSATAVTNTDRCRTGDRHRHDLRDAGVVGLLTLQEHHGGAGVRGVEQLHQAQHSPRLESRRPLAGAKGIITRLTGLPAKASRVPGRPSSTNGPLVSTRAVAGNRTFALDSGA